MPDRAATGRALHRAGRAAGPAGLRRRPIDPFAAGPQSGGRRAAPGRLALPQAFVNAHFDLRPERRGEDRFATADQLGEWLDERGLGGDATRVSEPARARAVALREGLRAVLAGHNGGAPEPRATGALAAASGGLRAGVEAVADGRVVAVAAAPGVEGALGLVLAVVAEAQAAGTWQRLKACPGDHCGWAFYDHSRNGGSTWCSMRVCGGREKARAYRARSRGA